MRFSVATALSVIRARRQCRLDIEQAHPKAVPKTETEPPWLCQQEEQRVIQRQEPGSHAGQPVDVHQAMLSYEPPRRDPDPVTVPVKEAVLVMPVQRIVGGVEIGMIESVIFTHLSGFDGGPRRWATDLNA
jgi:hypothetical protein